jgi:cytochrome P450
MEATTGNDNAEPVAASYAPYDPTLVPHYWETITQLREQCPVAHSDAYPGWIITSYDAVWQAARDWQNFANFPSPVLPYNEGALQPLPDASDPPEQVVYHRVLTPPLAPQVVDTYEPDIRRIADELLTTMSASSNPDLVSDFALPMPARVFFEAVIHETRDIDRVYRLSREMIAEADTPAANRASGQLAQWCRDVLAERRHEPGPGDLLDAIVTEGGKSSLSEEEQYLLLLNVVFGALDTTTSALGSACYRILTDEPVRGALLDDPSLVPAAVEEVLRMDPPVIHLARTCARDTTFGDAHIRKGEWLLLCFGGANRDPAQFDNPETFDLARPGNRHLTFGLGTHRCVGSNLARATLRIGVEQLLQHVSRFRLPDDFVPEYYQRNTRYIRSLPVAVAPQ